MDHQTKIRLIEANESILFAVEILSSVISEIGAAIDQIRDANSRINSAFYLARMKRENLPENVIKFNKE